MELIVILHMYYLNICDTIYCKEKLNKQKIMLCIDSEKKQQEKQKKKQSRNLK